MYKKRISCFGCLVFSFLHSLILMFMTVKAQTTRETKLLYCSIFRFSISTHGPNSLSNLCRSSFTHLSRPCACTVAARGLLSNNAISPKKKNRTKKMKIGIVFTHQFTCTELHMYRTSHDCQYECERAVHDLDTHPLKENIHIPIEIIGSSDVLPSHFYRLACPHYPLRARKNLWHPRVPMSKYVVKRDSFISSTYQSNPTVPTGQPPRMVR